MSVETLPSTPPAPARPMWHRRRELRRAMRSMVQGKWPLVALIVLLLVTIAAIFGPWISPLDPNRQDIMMRLADPLTEGRRHAFFWLGTDGLGRDVLSRLLYGARISL